jgi:DNA gyrase/topoisomerase IV subunit A
MSERTGLGPIETGLLSALDALGASFDHPHRKSANVLLELEHASGIGPRYAYDVLCDLARPWQVPVCLVDGHGNFGSPDDPAAGPRYTEARLTPAGALAVAAEQGGVPPLPIDLLNGSVYRGGARPPFEPTRLLDALIAIVSDPRVSDGRLSELAGVPAFPSGCEITGEVGALLAGRQATLHCSARITRAMRDGNAVLELTNFPPGWGSDRIGRHLAERVNLRHVLRDRPKLSERATLDLRDIRNESFGGREVLVCILRPGADVDEIERRVLAIWGVSIDVGCHLGAPLPTLLRTWVDRHATETTADALRRLRRASKRPVQSQH